MTQFETERRQREAAQGKANLDARLRADDLAAEEERRRKQQEAEEAEALFAEERDGETLDVLSSDDELPKPWESEFEEGLSADSSPSNSQTMAQTLSGDSEPSYTPLSPSFVPDDPEIQVLDDGYPRSRLPAAGIAEDAAAEGAAAAAAEAEAEAGAGGIDVEETLSELASLRDLLMAERRRPSMPSRDAQSPGQNSQTESELFGTLSEDDTAIVDDAVDDAEDTESNDSQNTG